MSTAVFRRESEETDRLLALTDGVIAIVITLLVLDLTVPTVPAGSSSAVLLAAVAEQWQEFFGFVLSFLVVGQYWVLHRRIFLHVERHPRGVVYLDLLFLLLVAFVPYATGVFAAYPTSFGVAFLSVALGATGLSLALLWIYAARAEIVEEGLTSRAVQIQATRFLASPLVFFAAVPLAFLDPRFAFLAWLTLVPINGALGSRLAEAL
jgi:uncharacterized membrane protein